MTKPDDGGPAFPHPDPQGPGPGAEVGMSLRDYFAAKAMHAELVTAGALVGPRDAFIKGAKEHGQTVEQHLAFCAYAVADAMIAHREKATR